MIEFGVLGPLIVHRDHQPVALNADMLRKLLVLLLHRAGRPLAVASIEDTLWPGQPPATARKTIQVYVGRLRKALGAEQRIRHSPGGYTITVAPDELDSHHYHEAVTLLRLGDSNYAAGNPDATRSAWQQALAILEELEHADADAVRQRLHDLDRAARDA